MLILPLMLLAGWYACARSQSGAQRAAVRQVSQASPLDAVIEEVVLEDLAQPEAEQPVEEKPTAPQPAEAPQKPQSQDQVGRLLDFAMSLLGKPYRYGGETPEGFDCSGYTSYVFRQFGVKLPHSSSMQYAAVTDRVARADLQPGDLVFYAGRAGGADINHVGIVTSVSGSDFDFIHAASTGIVVSHNSQTYYAERYIGAARVRW